VLAGRCEGGEPPPYIKNKELSPAENKEPTLARNNGGMSGRVKASKVTSAMWRGGQISGIQCYQPFHVSGLVRRIESMKVRSGSRWQSNGTTSQDGREFNSQGGGGGRWSASKHRFTY
jgi:hypothetical protein